MQAFLEFADRANEPDKVRKSLESFLGATNNVNSLLHDGVCNKADKVAFLGILLDALNPQSGFESWPSESKQADTLSLNALDL